MSRPWFLMTLLGGLLLHPVHAQTVDHPLHAGDSGVQPPKLVQQGEPIFPKTQFSAHPLGCGQAYLIIDTAGAVFEAKLRKSTGYEVIDAAFLAAIRQDRFTPAIKDGQPVSVDMYMELCIDPV
jgi:TonB family protein